MVNRSFEDARVTVARWHALRHPLGKITKSPLNSYKEKIIPRSAQGESLGATEGLDLSGEVRGDPTESPACL